MRPEIEWVEVSLDIPLSIEDPLVSFLFDMGSHGIFTDRAKSRPYFELMTGPRPERAVLLAYFIRSDDLEEKLARIKEFIRSAARARGEEEDPRVDYDLLKDEDWSENWKCLFRVARVGSRVIIKPSWEEYSPSPGEVVVEMTAGMAFGTGTHESTRLSLLFLEDTIDRMRSGNGSVSLLDVGTGSGILGIAAVKLGAQEVLGIDIDPRAVEIARNNALLNQVGREMRVNGIPLEEIRERYDIVVANIFAEDLIEIRRGLTARLRPGGYLILSGILIGKRDKVRNAFTGEGLRLDREEVEGEWVGFCFQNPSKE